MSFSKPLPSWQRVFSFGILAALMSVPMSPGIGPVLAQESAASKTVVATGETPLTAENEALLRERALKVAFRAAVEKGLGSFVTSTTRVSNFSEIQDKITSRADGYVLGYDVVREWRTADSFNVQISAQVGLEQIKADFASLTKRVASQLGNPSIAFILNVYQGEYKIADLSVIDAFQQEFLNKGFDLKATDKARAAAVANLQGGFAIEAADRSLARRFGAQEGANYVARGKVDILDLREDAEVGGFVATAKVGVEIIDSATGDVVASYSDTVRTNSPSEEEARAQAIKKNAVVAARTLASQTVGKWQDRASNGQLFTVILQGVRSSRTQERPLKKEIASFAEIRHAQMNSSVGVLTMDILFRGSAEELEEQIYQHLEKNPIFKALDKESQQGNTLTFKLEK